MVVVVVVVSNPITNVYFITNNLFLMSINQFKYQFFSFKSLERNLLYSFCPNIPYSSIML